MRSCEWLPRCKGKTTDTTQAQTSISQSTLGILSPTTNRKWSSLPLSSRRYDHSVLCVTEAQVSLALVGVLWMTILAGMSLSH